MINRKRYYYEEVKDTLEKQEPTRVQHHPIARTWAELDEGNRCLFYDAAQAIQKIIPDATCYAFGSRMLGNWNDNSDIDIRVCASEKEFAKLKAEKITVEGLPVEVAIIANPKSMIKIEA